MHYIIYQIVNKINGKIYIGKHTCKSIYDCYMSGCRQLWQDIKKYGIENFEKTILWECRNQEELDKKEAELVNQEFINRNDTYNQQIGGKFGGNKIDYSNRPEIIQANKKNSNEYWNSVRNDSFKQEERHQSLKLARKRIKEREDYQDIIDRIASGRKKYYQTHDGTFSGKTHTDETKKKISISHKKFHELNGPTWNVDHHWYYHKDSKQNKILTEHEYEKDYKDHGWLKGRWIFKNN